MMTEIMIGTRVRLTEKHIGCLLKTGAAKFAGRVGVVVNIYNVMGGYRPYYDIQWLRRGNRGKEFRQRFQRDDIEAIDD